MAEPYTPTEAEIVNGSYHLGDNFWRELTEAETLRGIAAIKAETLRAVCEQVETDKNPCGS